MVGDCKRTQRFSGLMLTCQHTFASETMEACKEHRKTLLRRQPQEGVYVRTLEKNNPGPTSAKNPKISLETSVLDKPRRALIQGAVQMSVPLI